MNSLIAIQIELIGNFDSIIVFEHIDIAKYTLNNFLFVGVGHGIVEAFRGIASSGLSLQKIVIHNLT